jgi:hypothetical protein
MVVIHIKIDRGVTGERLHNFVSESGWREGLLKAVLRVNWVWMIEKSFK